jgi:hypothetical protein
MGVDFGIQNKLFGANILRVKKAIINFTLKRKNKSNGRRRINKLRSLFTRDFHFRLSTINSFGGH